MKRISILLTLFFPLILTGQVIKDASVIKKEYGSERWEVVSYNLQLYKIKDSVIEFKLREILHLDSSKLPDKWTYLMFVESLNDSLILRVELQNAPYKLPGLMGYFKISDLDILFYYKMPAFLTATKLSKKFSYERHLFKIGENSWMEFSGDDCSHSWTLLYFNKEFHVEE